MPTQPDKITSVLIDCRRGDRAVWNELLSLIGPELHRLVRRHLARERRDHSIQPSSLVQETFLRLFRGADLGWRNRAHFLAAASQVMRHVLVDYARDRQRQKRGAAVHIPIDAAVILSAEEVEQIVAVDLALQRLAQNDERKSRVFEIRFFGGLTLDEVAQALEVAPNTVIRDWDFARAWLRRELGVIENFNRGTLAG